MDIALRYGCNPHQTPARLLVAGDSAPLQIRNGRPGYISHVQYIAQTGGGLRDADVIAAAEQ